MIESVDLWQIKHAEPNAGPERPIRWKSGGMLIGGRPVSWVVIHNPVLEHKP
jgi:hypothetical protein